MEVRAELRRKYFRTLSRWTKQSYRRTSDTDDRWAGPHPEGITLVARHVDHTRILGMRDAWSHLVGKCSETPPSNIETRTYQVDGEKEREADRQRDGEKPAFTQGDRTRNPARASASYLCKRQFPGGVGVAFAYISDILRTHYTVFRWHIRENRRSPLRFTSRVSFTWRRWRRDRPHSPFVLTAHRIATLLLFFFSSSLLFGFVLTLLFRRQLRGETAVNIVQVKPLRRGGEQFYAA